MKNFFPALKLYLLLTALLGLAYPLATTGLARWLFSRRAGGSLIQRSETIVGSELIAQKFESPRYFWSRPSAIDYNPLASGGSNLGPISQILRDGVAARASTLGVDAPAGLLFTSGSGLDPHLDPEAVFYQVKRVASARGIDEAGLRAKVEAAVEPRELGFLGRPRINVLKLNLSLEP